MKNILLLGTKSETRKRLLGECQIPFVLVDQDADETFCDWGMPLQRLVETIAVHKMKHIVMPNAQEGDVRFVLTADTLNISSTGKVHGKPKDKQDAINMIKDMSEGSTIGTAICLDKKIFKHGDWELQQRIVRYSQSFCQLEIPDEWFDRYFEAAPNALCASGAYVIDGYGSQFLKRVDGDYSTILGMPTRILRIALEEIGFFN
ncbi:MAG: hypothetical protein UR26_C0005G0006 [candidate division TM6 bacterium GW2011_GWF2_32_72]|nr:MAG: hypothetical protein UR26_C0005G0006 [candidate division TM6 bacterium GW2011_GWF2_32_72]